ncbi:MAG: MarR family winged helix-turn-helix transcriptional regulator, partial [Sphingopyxis sp.]|nr:MarR family winged helix-turn-helix transcriptional regulator [Sphingopyxis sp.]
MLAGLVDERPNNVGFGRSFIDSKPIGFVPARRENPHSHFSPAEPLNSETRSSHEFPSAPVRRALQERRLREQFFPADMFSDPAWDILLDLYAAQLEGQTVAVSSLCIAAAVPSTTALRWIKTMTDAGMLERHDDPQDRRR